MSTLVVGDLHGQFEIVDTVLRLKEKEGHDVVFVGDYLDSYVRNAEDCTRTLIAVMDAIEEGGVTGCWGNHDRQYVDHKHLCSGYNPETQVLIDHLADRMHNLLVHYTYVGPYLVSHAGVSQALLDHLEIDLETYLESKNYDQIGWFRGGNDPYGGLYWCDWRVDFKPVPGTPQIVGHTRGNYIRFNNGSYCIDCLEDRGPSKILLIHDDDGVEEVEI